MNYLILIIGVFAVGFSGPLNTIAVTQGGFSGIQTACYRLLVASGFLLLLPNTWRHLSKAWPYRRSLIIGAFWLACHFALWTSAFAYTSLSSAVIFLCSQPLITYFLTRHKRGETMTGFMGIGLLMGMIGLIILGYNDFHFTGTALWGDLLVVLACIMIVFYQLSTRQTNHQLPWLAFNTSIWGLAGLILWPFAGFVPLSGKFEQAWWAIGCLAFLPTLVGNGAFNRVIPHLKLLLINISILVEPILSIGIGVFLDLDQWPQNEKFWASLCVLSGVALALLGEAWQAYRKNDSG